MTREIAANKIRMSKMLIFLEIALCSVLMLLFPINTYCQIPQETGFKHYQNYGTKEYPGQPQNYCTVQDNRGFIYTGNRGGLLEFDGVSWRKIKIPNYAVYSLAINDSGTIFVGGMGEIGFLKYGPKGYMQYQSLIEKIPKTDRKFSQVYKIHETQKGIIFYTRKRLYQWHSGEIFVLQVSSKRFDGAFQCNGKFYAHQEAKGLLHFVDGRLEPVAWNIKFEQDVIQVLVPYDKDRILVGARHRGFFLVTGNRVEPFSTELNAYAKEEQLYSGIILASGDFALTTRLGGLIIMDKSGKLKQKFTTANGLPVNNVKHVFQDKQGNLWLSLNQGITKIEYASPISFYDKRSGLYDLVLSVTKHNNTIYSGTSSGLNVLLPEGVFEEVKDLRSTCLDILSTGDSLLAATIHALYQIENNQTHKVVENTARILAPSKMNRNRVWVGRSKGLASIIRNPGSNLWQQEFIFTGIRKNIRSIAENHEGSLWIGFSSKGVVTKVDFLNGKVNETPTVTNYGESHGLPKSSIRIFSIKNRETFATNKGLYRFDKGKNRFVPDTVLGEPFTGGENGDSVFRLAEDESGDIFLQSRKKIIWAAAQPDGSFQFVEKPLRRLSKDQTNYIYPDPFEKKIWFARHNGLFVFDKKIKKKYDSEFNIIIREMSSNEKPVFETLDHKETRHLQEIQYQDRNIQIRFAAPFLEGEPLTQYQYRLDGYKKTWSKWAEVAEAEYTNLDSGKYIFRVQAKNIYGTLSSEAGFQLRILPPWSKTWWAYSLYIIFLFTAVFFFIKWRLGKLKREKKRLEKIVTERTNEIQEKNLQLQDQSEKLKELDTIKSRFFANISHEFRTPLTLLTGPLEQMIDDCSPNEAEKKRKLTLMQRNAQRLLRLINQLLELSRLDSGKMKLQSVQTRIIPFISGITDSFGFLAQQREIELRLQQESPRLEEISIYIDPRKLEDIITNLLINALKFTPPGGKVVVSVSCDDQGDKTFRHGFIEISVQDTGPGLSGDQLDNVFDRFYQADSTYEYHQKGSGIGLALCKELVELHGGKIYASASKEQGSRFTIRLHMGKTHLSEDQIKSEPDDSLERQLIMEETENPAVLSIPSGPGLENQEQNIILVVEDSADMREYIRTALEAAYTIVEAKDGKQGLETARSIIPDLIVSDVMMPEMDGNELCRSLKEDIKTSHIPVILLTAKASEENILEGLSTGADDYVTKPFSTKILAARIKNLIDIRGQLQQNLGREMALRPVKTSVSSIDREFLKEMQAVLRVNISDPEFNVEVMCRKMVMSNTTLYRKIQALSGQTPTEFIRSYRLKRAMQLLKSGFGSVTEVAFEVGFSSRAYFTKCFKEKFQQLPSDQQAVGPS